MWSRWPRHWGTSGLGVRTALPYFGLALAYIIASAIARWRHEVAGVLQLLALPLVCGFLGTSISLFATESPLTLTVTVLLLFPTALFTIVSSVLFFVSLSSGRRATEPHVVDPADPVPLTGLYSTRTPGRGVSIRFREITFRYPGTMRPVLQDFDLTVPAGEVAAIVGPNGAEKSTLIKLLCRFYDPGAGSIELGGVDVRDLPLAELRRQITVLFQDTVRYNATVAGNIGMGDLSAASSAAQIETAARAAGADEIVARLPQEYETQLGTWFEGGTDLSVGEWQRIALARAFLRQAPIIVLDEPTSAMDSWAEMDWLSRFRALASGHTAIIITHRFTTAMHADTIHVMHQGYIVESGNHNEGLARGGRYARSWIAQMQLANADG